jgi:hypothetical protein
MMLEDVLLSSESAAAWLGIIADESRQLVICDRIYVLEIGCRSARV